MTLAPVFESITDVLRYRTPGLWVGQALADPLALLHDHVYLERKAAVNVLDLWNRWPEGKPSENWTRALSAVARDETSHLVAVSRLFFKRGGTIAKCHKTPYAMDLRRLVRQGRGNEESLDRLLVSALIELRSSERFELLGRLCPDREMAALYKGLEASERGHYKIFLRLAREVLPAAEVKERWSWMLDQEALIIQAQAPGPRLHSGVAE